MTDQERQPSPVQDGPGTSPLRVGIARDAPMPPPDAPPEPCERGVFPTLSPMVLSVCESCRNGEGGECHTPGCAFWMSAAPDIPLSGRLTRGEMIEAGAAAIHGGKGCTCRAGAKGDAEAVLLAASAIPEAITEDGPGTSPHQPRRDDDVAAWLKRMRDRWQCDQIERPEWRAIDGLLDRYRECADYGLTLRPEDDERGDP